MEKTEYIELLQKARSSLPEHIFEKNRFEIPKIDSFQEGNRTIITNWQEITKQINRNEHLSKLLAKNLATFYVEDGKRIIFTGKFSRDVLNKQLGDYVKKYVLCGECKKPDTKLVKQERILFIHCEACGARQPVLK